MAYMDQEKKARIATELKEIFPKGWKYSLKVENYSKLILTIRSAPVNLLDLYKAGEREHVDISNREWTPVSPWDNKIFATAPVIKEIFAKIIKAMNLDNHDNSDPMTDYSDVGHYVDIRIGEWCKPFVMK